MVGGGWGWGMGMMSGAYLSEISLSRHPQSHLRMHWLPLLAS